MGNPKQQSCSYPINEIFTSIQGEGFWTGLPVTFIRFAGCNLSCSFCDTDFSIREKLAPEEIADRVSGFSARTLIFTGGEPLIHPLADLVKILKIEGFKIHVETNGSIAIPDRLFDWVTVSPKTNNPLVRKCDEVKILIKSGEIPQDRGISADHYFISPLNPGLNEKSLIHEENLKYCIEYVLKNPKWRLNVQLHKYLGIK